jgi:hypothetical protein
MGFAPRRPLARIRIIDVALFRDRVPFRRPAFVRGLLAAALAVLAATAPAEELRVGTIEIVANDVFTEQEELRGTAYRVTNSLHVKTRENVIRKFLLFREGDPYVASRLEESERNLRALPFIQSASVTAGEPRDGVVDVVVVTQDSWSTQPGGSLGSAGGETDFSVEIEETNFLGLGKQVTVFYESDVDRSGLGVRYNDPAALGRYWRAGVLYLDNSDGTQAELEIERPFYSFATPWSVSTELGDRTFETRLYADGAVASEFRQVSRTLDASYGRAIAPNDARAHRISAGIDWQSDEFSPVEDGATTILPVDREYRYVFASYEYAQNHFVKVDFVDRDFRHEDLRLGTRFTMRLGVSPETFGVETTTGMAAASLYRGFEVGRALLLAGVAWESRLGDTNRNAILSGELRWIRKHEGLVHPQTTIARISVRRGDELDADRQFFADGSNGLRGYRLYSFAGDSAIVMNLEHRLFLGREVWQFLSPGLAVFVDAGNAAYGSETFDPGNLKVDAGVGIRLGVTRSTRNILRLDFAYAFDPDPFGRAGWLVSFSGSQAF